VHERLAGVVIENLEWMDFIDRYDRPETLFYLDPPYFGNENDYGKTLFSREQFALMAERLRTLKGRFVMSINDVPFIRDLFANFRVEEVELRYSVARGNSTNARELIISHL
jgi:DNA adenine methylase